MPKKGRAGQSLLAAFLLAAAATVIEPAAAWAETRCLDWSPVRRTGTERCWAEARTDTGGKLCFSRVLWSSWLFSGQPRGKCLEVALRDRVSSAPHNLGTDPPKSLRITEEVLKLETRSAETRELRGQLWSALERWRERVGTRLEGADPTGVFRALVLQQTTPGSPLGLYRLLGFVHLATAAGVHLYAIQRTWLGIVFRLASLTGLSPRRARIFARLSAWIWTLLAWALSGFRPGLLRPWLVIALRSAAESQGLRFRRYAPLAISLGLDLAVAGYRGEGLSLHSGRWVYALAVGGALSAWEGTGRSALRSHARMAVSSWAATAVLEAWISGLCAPLTPVLSLMTLPLFCSILYPLLFFDSLLPLAPVPVLLRLASSALEALFALTLQAPALWVLPRWAVLLGMGGGAAIAAGSWRTVAGRAAIAFSLAVPASLAAAMIARPAARDVIQLDVGQGDAAWVRSATSGLIDTGAPGALRAEKWIELFASDGRTELDWVALTHLDQDHSGGLLELSRLLPVGCVELSPAEEASERGQALARALHSRGIHVGIGCARVPVLHPEERTPSSRPNGRMSAYFVPLLSRGVRIGSYLGAGDASVSDEARIVRWALGLGWADHPLRIFKLGHHGSKTSSGPETLRLLRPTDTWVSVGAGNRYGHPHPIVLGRLRAAGLIPARTDQSGALFPPRKTQ